MNDIKKLDYMNVYQLYHNKYKSNININELKKIIKLINIFDFYLLDEKSTIKKSTIVNRIDYDLDEFNKKNIIDLFIKNYSKNEFTYNYIINLIKIISNKSINEIININNVYKNYLNDI